MEGSLVQGRWVFDSALTMEESVTLLFEFGLREERSAGLLGIPENLFLEWDWLNFLVCPIMADRLRLRHRV